MFHSRYYINYGRIFGKLVNKNNDIDHNVMNFLVTLMSPNDMNLNLLIQSISLLEAKNMFIYSFQDKAVKVVFKEFISVETKENKKKELDDFDNNSNDDIIYTDFMKNYCSCKEYQMKYNRYLLQDNYSNHIELKETVSLIKLLENEERLGIDLIGLLSYDIVMENNTETYDFENETKLLKHLKKFIAREYIDINLVYNTGDLICPHLLCCNILLKNGYINIAKSSTGDIILSSNYDDEVEVINDNKVFNYYVNVNKSVYKLYIENLNDWLYLQYNII
ncbi:hypothetical protein QEN19_001750 [Hanseniaspora menglaensis]